MSNFVTMDFRDKTIVVTGASSGIGLALVRAFASRGANVVLAARSKEKLDAVARELPSALAVECDVACEADCRHLIEAAVARFGGIDVLVNNAGLSMRAVLDDVSLDVLHRLMDVNFWGTVYSTKFALPYIQQSKGTIVGISSVAGFHGLPGRTGYSASKFAMQGFLETVRVENLRKGVKVMIVAPGFTASNVRFSALTADGSAQGASPRKEEKMMSAEKVASLVVSGVARGRREMLLDFDGRATVWLRLLAPRWLDKQYYKHMAHEPDSPLI
ncbi:MAG: SDR family oxidoreductase [Mucinivorans sp.]